MEINTNMPMLMKKQAAAAQGGYRGQPAIQAQTPGLRKAVRAHSILSKLEQTGRLNMTQSPMDTAQLVTNERYPMPTDSMMSNPLPNPPQPTISQIREQDHTPQTQGYSTNMYGRGQKGQQQVGLLMDPRQNMNYRNNDVQMTMNMNNANGSNNANNAMMGGNMNMQQQSQMMNRNISGRGAVTMRSTLRSDDNGGSMNMEVSRDTSRNKDKVVYMCEVCDVNKADFYCSNCGGFFCEKCYERTHESRLYKKHSRIPVSQYIPPPPCPCHPNNPATHYCLNCNQLCCVDCIIGHPRSGSGDNGGIHRTHDIIDVSETVPLTIKRLTDIIKKTRDANAMSNSIVNSISTKKNLVEKAASEGLDALASSFNDAMSIFESKIKDIKRAITNAKDIQVGGFDRKYAAMDDFGSRMKEYCSKAEKMVESAKIINQTPGDRTVRGSYTTGKAAAIINQVEKLEILINSALDSSEPGVMDENMELARIIIEENSKNSAQNQDKNNNNDDSMGLVSNENIKRCLKQIEDVKEAIMRISLE